MLDKPSVYNFLAEEMHFWQMRPMEFQLFGLSTACLKLSKLIIRFLKPEASFCINFA